MTNPTLHTLTLIPIPRNPHGDQYHVQEGKLGKASYDVRHRSDQLVGKQVSAQYGRYTSQTKKETHHQTTISLADIAAKLHRHRSHVGAPCFTLIRSGGVWVCVGDNVRMRVQVGEWVDGWANTSARMND